MKHRPIIAIDIDDVLSNSMEAVRVTANEYLGVNLQPEHYTVPGPYWSYYETVWKGQGMALSFDDLSEELIKSRYLPHLDAAHALKQLAKKYKLVVISSRREQWWESTREWLERHFGGLISEIVFAGNKEHAVQQSKGEVCARLGAQWLIDDNVDHCADAQDHGVMPLLFGTYGWQKKVPPGITRCKDWQAVLEYFDGLDRP